MPRRSASLLLLLAACGEPAKSPEASSSAPASVPPAAEGSTTSTPGASPAAAAPGAWPYAPAPTEEERKAQRDRLKPGADPLRTNWTPPGRSARYGHAEGLVDAPLAAVKTKLGDFMHYKELAGPKFKSVKVVDKKGDATDLYFQLPIMKGMITLWYVTRFSPVKSAPAGDVVEGTFVRGNIKDMHLVLTVSPGRDDKSTTMVCDIVLAPNVPAPESALDEELRDACGDAINSTRELVKR